MSDGLLLRKIKVEYFSGATLDALVNGDGQSPEDWFKDKTKGEQRQIVESQMATPVLNAAGVIELMVLYTGG